MDSEKQKAIALCRVSSDEQLKNNSMNRQQEAVENIAKRHDLEIVKTWKLSISSKDGRNIGRKDLGEMLGFCQKNRKIKYLLVDEPDRFMRSEKERCYFEVLFNQLGVKILYSNELFNGSSWISEVQKSMMFIAAQGSNEERARKTKSGHEKAIRDGRYPFVTKLGYRRGPKPGIAEIDPVMGPLLKEQLMNMARGISTPTVALQDFNKAVKAAGIKRAPLKMDKWRKISTDSYYCGILEIHKVVDAYNPNGLHEKLITLATHKKLVEIFNGKPKNQKGPNASGNPLYPFSNMVTHVGCPLTKDKYNRFTGVTVKNSQKKVYEKYKCRGCNMYISREDITTGICDIISSMKLTSSGKKALTEALTEVFEMEAGDIDSKEKQLNAQRAQAESDADKLLEQYLAERPGALKDEIKKRCEAAMNRVKSYTKDLADLEKIHTAELCSFVKFALGFVDNLAYNVSGLSPQEMQLCKQLLFPDGFFIDENRNVYTTKISPLYRLKATKKDPSDSEKSSLVRMKRL